ncbi:hypothetical protein Goklo_025358 [Gossypium klotzschianum]|uniref:Uncharacterized protein n=1 Tax=Gossypium klotzschianum TaxID=34286 RepID=A0A7J8WAK1_9ROSI|nr:hypothetical protein [Gossypium klotzschianum]
MQFEWSTTSDNYLKPHKNYPFGFVK